MTASPPVSGTKPVPPSKVLAARTRLWIAAVLAAIAIAIYSNSLGDGFTLDSSFILLRDPRIQKATADNLKLILTKDYWFPNFDSGLYRPFTTLTFLFNYAVLGNGSSPLGYRCISATRGCCSRSPGGSCAASGRHFSPQHCGPPIR